MDDNSFAALVGKLNQIDSGRKPSEKAFKPKATHIKDGMKKNNMSSILENLYRDVPFESARTTASDALRMGLPWLTLKGSSYQSRMAASIVSAVNLPELITTSQQEYESLAIELATDLEKLKIIKDKLLGNLSTAPLYDTPKFTRNLESAYSEMYDRYQKGLDPDHIYVEQ